MLGLRVGAPARLRHEGGHGPGSEALRQLSGNAAGCAVLTEQILPQRPALELQEMRQRQHPDVGRRRACRLQEVWFVWARPTGCRLRVEIRVRPGREQLTMQAWTRFGSICFHFVCPIFAICCGRYLTWRRCVVPCMMQVDGRPPHVVQTVQCEQDS